MLYFSPICIVVKMLRTSSSSLSFRAYPNFLSDIQVSRQKVKRRKKKKTRQAVHSSILFPRSNESSRSGWNLT